MDKVYMICVEADDGYETGPEHVKRICRNLDDAIEYCSKAIKYSMQRINNDVTGEYKDIFITNEDMSDNEARNFNEMSGVRYLTFSAVYTKLPESIDDYPDCYKYSYTFDNYIPEVGDTYITYTIYEMDLY